MKLRSADAAYQKYEVNEDGVKIPVTYSAYQRKEILELDTDTQKIKIIGNYKSYLTAVEEVEKFNRKQHEQSTRSR